MSLHHWSAWIRKVLALFGAASVMAGTALAAPQPGGWKLVWEDNFDGPKLDRTKWSVCERGRSDWNDTMTNDARCFAFTNGVLQLRGFVDERSDPASPAYLTGGVTSEGRFAFTYGKVEIRARFKSARGAWPALWMLGTGARWPANGEIDLMEHLNYDTFIYQTVHSAYTKNRASTNSPPHGGKADIRRDDFNVYGLEWYADRLVITVDGKGTFTYPRVPSAGAEQWPFDHPFYFILSMQIGGKWVGKEDPNDYPAWMEIDWVRVYEAVK